MDRVNTQRRQRTQSGFTLIEVMIAFGILGFGMLTMAVMQIQALKQGAMGRHTSEAAAVARTYLEQAHRLPWSALDGAVVSSGGSWSNPGWAGVTNTMTVQMETPGGGSAIEQSYGVRWRVTTPASTTCLRDIEVQISWQERDVGATKVVVVATRRYNWGGTSC